MNFRNSFYISVLSALFSVLLNSSYAEEIRDYYSEPGINPFKETVNQNFNESIDPFSGTIQLKYMDLSIPGNGGMDININRVYTSLQTNSYPRQSVGGFGWTMHFGRIVVPKLHRDKICNQSQWQTTTNDNPSIELPDGGRELLVLNSTSGDSSLITRSNWKASCVNGQPGMVVTSPSGIKYFMDQYELYQDEPSWFTSRIEDLHGNWIRIEYETNPTGLMYITSIYRSEEGESVPVVRYEYENQNTSQIRLKSITANEQKYEYLYEDIAGLPAGVYRQLKEVIRPDGAKWIYQYLPKVSDPIPDDGINEDGLGSYSLEKVTYPNGATINYTYQYVQFEPDSSQKTTSVHTKLVDGSAVEGAAWTYQFSPHSHSETFDDGPPLRLDVTTVTFPSGSYKFYHYGKDFKTEGLSYYFFKPSIVGSLKKKETYDSTGTMIERTANVWSLRKISNENFWHGGNRSWWNEFETNVPVLVSEWLVRDQGYETTTYAHYTQYSGHDAYGNPSNILDNVNVQGGAPRRTVTTYINDTENWIIGLPKDTLYYEGDKPVGSIEREYYEGTGKIRESVEFGVKTLYTYTNEGDIQSITNANNVATYYSDYKRGIARTEALPESITIHRSVNDTGTLGSEANGRGFITSFQYDDLNRLTHINYPINSDVDIGYTNQTGTTKRTLTRGTYQQTDLTNDFGQVLSVERLDLVTGLAIVTNKKYDALNRLIFTSYPNSEIGETTQYDPLGRVKETQTPGNFKVKYQHNGATVKVTNARNKETEFRYRVYGARVDEKVLVSRIDPENTATSFVKDIFGNTLEIFQGDYNSQTGQFSGYKREYKYDDRNYLYYTFEPEIGETVYTRDDLGNVLTEQKNSSGKIRFKYDDLSRLKEIIYPGHTPDIQRHYDNNSNLKRVVKGQSSWEYDFDENDNLKTEKLTVTDPLYPSPKIYTLTTGYNALDNVESLTYPSGLSVDFAPDSFGRATKVGTFASNVQYFPGGQVRAYTLGNGKQVSMRLNDRQLTENVSVNGLVDLTYNYDGNQNVTSITDAINASQNIQMDQPADYDGLDRIRGTRGPWGSWRYSYDSYGNLNYKSKNGIWPYGSYQFDEKWRLTFDAASRASFTYDELGNVRTKTYGDPTYETSLYHYDDSSELVYAKKGSTVNRLYAYDGNGHRFSEKSPPSYSTIHSVYSLSGELLFEDDLGSCSQTDYIKLGNVTIARSENKIMDPSLQSDSDGISDCIETQIGLNPFSALPTSQDTDGDGLTDILEHGIGSSIYVADTDSDGLSDSQEKTRSTNAAFWDTDFDRIADGYEVANGGDPKSEANSTSDSDMDGLNFRNEYYAGTRPDLRDTDSDGMDDKFELAVGLRPDLNEGIDLVSDLDADGIVDYLENFLNLDSNTGQDAYQDLDGDGFSNRQEIYAGTRIDSIYSSPKNGKVLWTSSQIKVRTPPLLDENGNLFFYGDDQSGYAVFSLKQNGSLRWRRSITSDTNNVLVSKDTAGCIFVVQGSALRCFDSLAGSELWNVSVGSQITSIPSIDSDGSILIGTLGGTLYAISPQTRQIIWGQNLSTQDINSIAISQTKEIYVSGKAGNIHALSPSGEEKWVFKTASPASLSLGSDGRLYARTKSKLYILNREGSLIRSIASNYYQFDESFVNNGKYSLQSIVSPVNKLLAIESDRSATSPYTYLFSLTEYSPQGQNQYASKKLIQSSSSSTIASFTAPLLSNNGTIYVVIQGIAYAIDSAGSTLWTFDLRTLSGYVNGAQELALGQDGVLYVSSQSGIVALTGTKQDVEHRGWAKVNRNNALDASVCSTGYVRFQTGIDTDGDGTNNCNEFVHGYDIFNGADIAEDVDGDLLSNTAERLIGTDEFNTDSDFDLLSDYQETASGTSPIERDSDHDGLTDMQELDVGMNPLDSEDAFADVDADRYSSRQEVKVGTDLTNNQSVPANGREIWAFRGSRGGHSSPAVMNDDHDVYHIAGNDLFAIQSDGTTRWTFRLQGLIQGQTPALSTDGTIYISSSLGISAINEQGALTWHLGLPAAPYSSPSIGGSGTLYVGVAGTAASTVYAVSSEGTELWHRDLDCACTVSKPVIDINGDIIFSAGTYIYKLNQNGVLKWSYQNGSTFTKGMVLDKAQNIYVVGSDAALYSLDSEGQLRWTIFAGDEYQVGGNGSSFGFATLPVIDSSGVIYIADGKGDLYAVQANGRIGWTWKPSLSSTPTSAPLITSNGDLYYGLPPISVNGTSNNLATIYVISTEGQTKREVILENSDTALQDKIVGLNKDSDGAIVVTTTDRLIAYSDVDAQMSGSPFSSTVSGGNSGNICRSTSLMFLPTSDSDADGIDDCSEHINGLDAFDALDAPLDADSDGISNEDEITQGLNPTSSDTDLDGISDYAEINTYNTDPNDWDSDDDKVSDGLETRDSQLDPLDPDDGEADSDGDGISNAQEEISGSDALDPLSLPGGFNKYWAFELDSKPVGMPRVDLDGNVYVATTAGILYSMDPKGKRRWSVNFGSQLTQPPLIGNDGKIYVPVPNYGLQVVSNSGAIVDSLPIASGIASIVITDPENRLYFISGGGVLHVYDSNIEPVWNYSFNENAPTFWDPVIGLDGAVYLLSKQTNKLYAISRNGEKIWELNSLSLDQSLSVLGSQDQFRSELAVDADGTVLISGGQLLYVIGIDGNILRKVNAKSTPSRSEEAEVHAGATIDNKGIAYTSLYSASNSSVRGFGALNIANGNLVWATGRPQPQDILSSWRVPSLSANGTSYFYSGQANRSGASPMYTNRAKAGGALLPPVFGLKEVSSIALSDANVVYFSAFSLKAGRYKLFSAFENTGGLLKGAWPMRGRDLRGTGNLNIQDYLRDPSLPSLAISSPVAATYEAGDAVLLSASAVDMNSNDLGSGITWSSSIDGPLGTGASIVKSTLSAGDHTIVASVQDNSGLKSVASVKVSIDGDHAPILNLISPRGVPTFQAEQDIVLEATATDDIDGNISSSIEWSTYSLGVFGLGSRVVVNSREFNVGEHYIQAKITDSAGHTEIRVFPFTKTYFNGYCYSSTVILDMYIDGNMSNNWSATVYEGQNVEIRGKAYDPNYVLSRYIGYYLNNRFQLQGKVYTTNTLPIGTHSIVGSLNNAPSGVCQYFSMDSVQVKVVQNPVPMLSIDESLTNSTHIQGQAIVLSGSATDVPDGDISQKIVWRSSLDGDLGTGSNLQVNTMSLGQHLITASVTDRFGKSQSASVNLTITEPSDLDNDGIADFADADMDGDGFNNDFELASGTDPANGDSMPGPQPDISVLGTSAVGSNNSYFSIYDKVATSSSMDGDQSLVWIEDVGSQARFNIRHYEGETASWYPTEIIGTESGLKFGPRLAQNSSGDLMLVYRAQLPATGLIARYYSSATQTWSGPYTLTTESDISSHTVAVDSNGRATVVWSVDKYVTGEGVPVYRYQGWVRHFQPEAGWDSQSRVLYSQDRGFDEGGYWLTDELKMDGSNNLSLLVVYNTDSELLYLVFRLVDGQFILDRVSGSEYSGYYYDFDVDAQGNIMLAYSNVDYTNPGIDIEHRRAGDGTWLHYSLPTPVEPFGVDVTTANGRAAVKYNRNPWQVPAASYLFLFDAGTWQPAAKVSDYPVRVELADNGNMLLSESRNSHTAVVQGMTHYYYDLYSRFYTKRSGWADWVLVDEDVDSMYTDVQQTGDHMELFWWGYQSPIQTATFEKNRQ